MGVVISFSRRPRQSGETWLAANWIFRQLAQDVIACHSQDPDIAAAFETAKDYGHLAIESLTPALAARVTAAIRQVAIDILADKVPTGIVSGSEGDPRALEPEYRKALRDLLEVISVAEKHRRST